MGQNASNMMENKANLENLVIKARRDKLVDNLKLTLGVVTPIAALAGIANFIGYSDNPYVANLLALGLGTSIGVAVGPAYVEFMSRIAYKRDIDSRKLARYQEYIKETK